MTPVRRVMAIRHLQTPQWSFKIMQDNTIVKAGEEKKIAVQSPRGILATATNIPSNRNPPSTP